MGTLLILAPWQSYSIGNVNEVPSNTDYSIFHNLNKLAEEIYKFDGEAVIARGQNTQERRKDFLRLKNHVETYSY